MPCIYEEKILNLENLLGNIELVIVTDGSYVMIKYDCSDHGKS